jgi:hypothetical protein
MGAPQRPKALYVTNGWYLELPGLVSPHFETLSGLKKSTGVVEIVDAGTNIKYKFHSQIIDFGAITLTRTFDGSPDDLAMRVLVDSSIAAGLQFDGVLVKKHFGQIVFSIGFSGLGFTSANYPTFDINAEEKFTVELEAFVTIWLHV